MQEWEECEARETERGQSVDWGFAGAKTLTVRLAGDQIVEVDTLLLA